MEEIGHLLLPWYDRFHRELPWRGVQDPYAIWVSETMLQQTRVETVRSYFPRFMARFPSLAALAQAPLEDVLKCWEGLGYYRRAQNLHRGAQQVMDAYGGRLPADPAALRRITGIGPYTAGAIASIAFGIPCPAVDGNVIRVVSRVAGIREDVAVPSVARQITATAASWIPLQRPGDFNQALMDLGASHCCPRYAGLRPLSLGVPVQRLCYGRRGGASHKSRSTPPRLLPYDVVLLRQENRMLLRQRTENLLQGLWVFPLLEGEKTPAQLVKALKRSLGLSCTYIRPLGPARHVFTHQVWEMRLHLLHASGTAPAGYQFATTNEINALPIPTAMRRPKALALEILSGTEGAIPCD